MFDLPDPETLYDALVSRDERFDGWAYVDVATTGKFCRRPVPPASQSRGQAYVDAVTTVSERFKALE